jgi:hypothetical protein
MGLLHVLAPVFFALWLEWIRARRDKRPFDTLELAANYAAAALVVWATAELWAP